MKHILKRGLALAVILTIPVWGTACSSNETDDGASYHATALDLEQWERDNQSSESSEVPVSSSESESSVESSSESPSEYFNESSSTPNISQGEPITIGTYDDGVWNLMLINRNHPVPDGYQVAQSATVQGNYSMDYRVADAMKQMIADARADGVNLRVISTIRSISYQEGLFNRNVDGYLSQGMSYDDAYATTAMNVAIPGTSEHHTGLAVDVLSDEWGSLTEGFSTTRAYAWLKENCARYGFIERYPSGKTDITKIVYEPWHYRYVGVEHATAIMQSGLTLEEYLGVY